MFYIFLLLFWTPAIDGLGKNFGYPSQPINRWKLHRAPSTWYQARQKCALEGSSLASPESDDKLKVLLDIMTQDNGSKTCGIFVGIHQTYTKGFFYTTNGIPLAEVSANLVSQCNKTLDNCLILRPDGTLNDVDCNDRYPFICHKTDSRKAPRSSCYSADTEYTLDDRTGSCYKFHKWSTFFYDATEVCAEENAHLVLINNNDEAEVLKELFAKNYPNSTGILASVGVLQWGIRWGTILGQPIEEVGYDFKWAPDKPDISSKKLCAAINDQIELNDLDCSLEMPFICEIPPENYNS